MQVKSNFNFLESTNTDLYKLAQLAERNCFTDPSTTLAKSRLLTEKLSDLLLAVEQIEVPLDKRQSNKLNLLSSSGNIPSEIITIFHTIRKSGNNAIHNGNTSQAQARYILRQVFYLTKWYVEVYEETDVYTDFTVPEVSWFEADSEKTKLLENQVALLKEKIEDFENKVKTLQLSSKEANSKRKERAFSKLKITETEAQTRETIDQQLRDAGWECDTETINFKKHKTLPEKGKYKAISEWKCDTKWADYALFNGLELIGIVEAKKHAKNVMSDLEQAKVYSKLVNPNHNISFPNHANKDTYKVPFMFATNGRKYLEQLKTASGIWFWDGRKQTNIANAIQGWFSPKDLIEKLNYDIALAEKKLANAENDFLKDPEGLNLRDYQIKAIEAVEDKILTNPHERRSLLAMATGTGKTRTMIGMCYRLIKSGRFKRILFLVDRTMLGKQAADSFKEVKIEGLQTFAQLYDLQSLEDKMPELDTKIQFTTVQGMVHRILYSDNPPSIGDFDCIVVDEAHRGYTLDREMDDEELILRNQFDFQSKYRQVLDYFDAYRIGLTATPAIHTAEIFGKPVFTYSYREAVVEDYLIDFEPPYVFQTKLGKEGIVWEKGDPIKIYDPEDNEIKNSGIAADEIKVEIKGFNRSVIVDSFNRNILSKLIADYGIHPEDKKKTLIFAATNIHADMIVAILKEEFAEYGEEVDSDAIVKITGDVYNRQDLLNKYKNDQYPSIVVTVDLLTTGIDVPSICNLVFLRRVNSRILYDQMIGRATRKCDEIDKKVFKIYDCVGVTEIMAKEDVMKPVAPKNSKTFYDLVEEISIIEDQYARDVKLDRIIAKLLIKVRSFNEQQQEQFTRLTGEENARNFSQQLKAIDPNNLVQNIQALAPLWDYLDHQKSRAKTYGTLYSEHQDKVEEVSRAYHKNLKPKDYIDSFNNFIKQNKNKIEALRIVCTKPSSLTRKDLKELRLILDEQGFNKLNLNTAHKQLTNQELVADIIAHIRTSALGSTLVSHQDRIRFAIKTLINKHNFNQIQLKWLQKIEMQLLKENIITKDDLNKPPFSLDGGLKRLDKIFKNETLSILDELHKYLYLDLEA